MSTGVSWGKVSSAQKVSGDLCWGSEGSSAVGLYKLGVGRALEGGGGECMEGLVEYLREGVFLSMVIDKSCVCIKFTQQCCHL